LEELVILTAIIVSRVMFLNGSGGVFGLGREDTNKKHVITKPTGIKLRVISTYKTLRIRSSRKSIEAARLEAGWLAGLNLARRPGV
jgi:hypothetical protein